MNVTDPRMATRRCPVLVSPYPGIFVHHGKPAGEFWRLCQQGTGKRASAFCYLHERLRDAGRLDPLPGTVAYLVRPPPQR